MPRPASLHVRWIVGAAALLVAPANAWCQPATASAAPSPANTRSYKPYSAIELTSYVFDAPRPIRAWTAKIDLADPEVNLVTTAPGDFPADLETPSSTTSEFAETYQVQMAINATPYTPMREHRGEGVDLLGLGAHDTNVYSAPHPQYGAFVITRDGQAEIWPAPIDENQLDRVDDAVGGYHVLLFDGRKRTTNLIPALPATFTAPQPRTAIGLSPDRKTLWLLIVDGRNRGRSEGMTLDELADWGAALGCASLLNMDGGGSTTLVVQDPASKAWRLVNQPVGRGILGTERFVGSHLGVRIGPAKSAAPGTPSP